MKIHNVEQGSQEWLDLRKGKMTASHACEIGNNGKGLESYIYSVLAEYYSSAEKEDYTNEQIERGQELEEQARGIYELKNGVEVKQVGFIEYNELVGCSPDGLINEDGGVEIKCHNDLVFFKLLATGEIDSKYLWQIQMNLLITGRKWWDYIGYNPNFKTPLVIKRIEPDQEMHKKLLAGFALGEAKIKELKEKLKL